MIHQSPQVAGNYLYHDEPDGTRLFVTQIYRPDNTPDWQECTLAEKEQWEEEHRPPEPEDIEPVEDASETPNE